MFVEDLPAWFIYAFAFFFGSLWGSFFNVAIYRWPRGMSVVSPPSHCPSCGTPVPALKNVPVLAYLWMRGRASCCGAKLTPRYVLVEVVCGLLLVALVQRHWIQADPGTPASDALLVSLSYFVLLGGLVVATFTDLEWMMIPDEVTLPGAALGLATVAIRDLDPVDAAVGAGVGYLLIQVVFVWSYERLTGRRGMGEGDAKLLLMIGAFLGWRAVLFAILVGSLQGIFFAMVAMLRKTPLAPDDYGLAFDPVNSRGALLASCTGKDLEEDVIAKALQQEAKEEEAADSEEAIEEGTSSGGRMRLRMPFGPFLALGALEWLFFGPQLVNAYFRWLGFE